MYGEGNCTTFFVEYLLLTAGTTSCVVTQPLHGNATYTVNNGHTHIHIESYSYNRIFSDNEIDLFLKHLLLKLSR